LLLKIRILLLRGALGGAQPSPRRTGIPPFPGTSDPAVFGIVRRVPGQAYHLTVEAL
jgi:hypothetical protein